MVFELNVSDARGIDVVRDQVRPARRPALAATARDGARRALARDRVAHLAAPLVRRARLSRLGR